MNSIAHRSSVGHLSRTALTSLALAAVFALASAPAAAAETKATETAPGPAKAPARHPLKGVVLEVQPDRSALIVKHEEIPGVMRAMTMRLKVDAATLAAAQKDQAITGLLVRKPDGWWLEEVKPAN
jgi:Cu/Ag efflux protein CusF